jgi:hypothetical protein
MFSLQRGKHWVSSDRMPYAQCRMSTQGADVLQGKSAGEDGALEGKCCVALSSTWVNEDLEDCI